MIPQRIPQLLLAHEPLNDIALRYLADTEKVWALLADGDDEDMPPAEDDE